MYSYFVFVISRSKEVPVFGPPIKEGAVYPKSKTFADFLLAKVVNAENAAHRSEKFATMATRTRQEYLKDLANNYSTNNVIESGQKFCKYIKLTLRSTTFKVTGLKITDHKTAFKIDVVL